jgi:hypothetical protein
MRLVVHKPADGKQSGFGRPLCRSLGATLCDPRWRKIKGLDPCKRCMISEEYAGQMAASPGLRCVPRTLGRTSPGARP